MNVFTDRDALKFHGLLSNEDDTSTDSDNDLFTAKQEAEFAEFLKKYKPPPISIPKDKLIIIKPVKSVQIVDHNISKAKNQKQVKKTLELEEYYPKEKQRRKQQIVIPTSNYYKQLELDTDESDISEGALAVFYSKSFSKKRKKRNVINKIVNQNEWTESQCNEYHRNDKSISEPSDSILKILEKEHYVSFNYIEKLPPKEPSNKKNHGKRSKKKKRKNKDCCFEEDILVDLFDEDENMASCEPFDPFLNKIEYWTEKVQMQYDTSNHKIKHKTKQRQHIKNRPGRRLSKLKHKESETDYPWKYEKIEEDTKLHLLSPLEDNEDIVNTFISLGYYYPRLYLREFENNDCASFMMGSETSTDDEIYWTETIQVSRKQYNTSNQKAEQSLSAADERELKDLYKSIPKLPVSSYSWQYDEEISDLDEIEYYEPLTRKMAKTNTFRNIWCLPFSKEDEHCAVNPYNNVGIFRETSGNQRPSCINFFFNNLFSVRKFFSQLKNKHAIIIFGVLIGSYVTIKRIKENKYF